MQVMNNARKIRILNIFGKMHRGGAETLQMHVLRHIDRSRFQMDFLVHTTEPGSYDEEIRSLGGNIIPCFYPERPLVYSRNFKRVMREHGPYDVIHSHVHYYSGLTLRLAQNAGIPVRIAQSHNDHTVLLDGAGIMRRLYVATARKMIYKHATLGLAVSREAADDLFGAQWQSDSRMKVFRLGIDLAPFHNPAADASAVRAELGIPKDAFVVGHVGRFEEQKNHSFIIDIASELAKSEPNMRFVLMGEGSLYSQIKQKAASSGLENCVIFAGVRADVARVLGAVDAFALPSFHEGLPLVLVEAQAAGLPCVISNVITNEVDLVKPLINRLSLNQSPSEWASAILASRNSTRPISQKDALSIVEDSPLNVKTSVRELEKLYQGV